MPWKSAGVSQRLHYLARTARKTGRARDIAVSRDPSFGNFTNRVADDAQHVTAIASCTRPACGVDLVRECIAGRDPDRGARLWYRPVNRAHRLPEAGRISEISKRLRFSATNPTHDSANTGLHFRRCTCVRRRLKP